MSPNQQKNLIKINIISGKEGESPLLKQKNNISEKNEPSFLVNKFTSQKKIETENSFSNHKCQNHPSKKVFLLKMLKTISPKRQNTLN